LLPEGRAGDKGKMALVWSGSWPGHGVTGSSGHSVTGPRDGHGVTGPRIGGRATLPSLFFPQRPTTLSQSCPAWGRSRGYVCLSSTEPTVTDSPQNSEGRPPAGRVLFVVVLVAAPLAVVAGILLATSWPTGGEGDGAGAPAPAAPPFPGGPWQATPFVSK